MINASAVSLSLVMPVYNEQGNIDDAIEQSMSALKVFCKSELIVVDDGSNDNTYNKIINISKKYNNLLVLRHLTNEGLAISLKDGFNKTLNEYITFNSADLPLHPEDIKFLIQNKYPFDLLVVERKKYSGASLWRKFISVCNRILIHIFFPLAAIDIADMNFTIIFKKEMLNNIFPNSKSPGFVLAEMILRAKYLKYDVKTVRADYHSRKYGNSTIGSVKNIIISLYDILCFRIFCLLLKEKNQ